MGSDRWILSHNAFSRQSSVSKSLANTNPEDIDSGLFFCGNAIDELNQIGIKIDMYRQEYRFTPAFAFIQAV